jgi:hypothetical protein
MGVRVLPSKGSRNVARVGAQIEDFWEVPFDVLEPGTCKLYGPSY